MGPVCWRVLPDGDGSPREDVGLCHHTRIYVRLGLSILGVKAALSGGAARRSVRVGAAMQVPDGWATVEADIYRCNCETNRAPRPSD